MAKLKYAVLNPAGNITVLVESPVKAEDREFVSKVLMLEEPSAEQVGFIKLKKDSVSLVMAGGEFCGNAVRCASLLTKKNVVSIVGRDIKCDGVTAFIPKDIDGIKHIIYEEMIDNPEERIKVISEGKATGFMFFDEKNMALKPLVYVPSADTLFWENSCASGTAALATYLAERDNKEIDLEIKEPGGILKIKTTPQSSTVELSGNIELIYEKELEFTEI